MYNYSEPTTFHNSRGHSKLASVNTPLSSTSELNKSTLSVAVRALDEGFEPSVVILGMCLAVENTSPTWFHFDELNQQAEKLVALQQHRVAASSVVVSMCTLSPLLLLFALAFPSPSGSFSLELRIARSCCISIPLSDYIRR
jgi:hypothetical protein